MKVESESKIKLLSDEMKTLRKEFSNYVQTAKQKIHILENSFKQLKGQSSQIEANLKKEHLKLQKEVDFLRNNYKSLIDIAVKEAEKASTNVVKVAIKTYEKTQVKVLNRL